MCKGRYRREITIADDGPRRYRCGKGRTALLLGGGAFGNSGHGGALGVGAARRQLEQGAGNFAALAPAAQEQQLMAWANTLKSPPATPDAAKRELVARNQHDLATYAQAMAVVAKRRHKGLTTYSAGPNVLDAQVDGELQKTLGQIQKGHGLSDTGTALVIRQQLDVKRAAGEVAHCRACGRFVSGAVDTPSCPHCTGQPCPSCAAGPAKLAAAPRSAPTSVGKAGQTKIVPPAAAMVNNSATGAAGPLPQGYAVNPDPAARPNHYDHHRQLAAAVMVRQGLVPPVTVTVPDGRELAVEYSNDLSDTKINVQLYRADGTMDGNRVAEDGSECIQAAVANHITGIPCPEAQHGSCPHRAAAAAAVQGGAIAHCPSCGKWMNTAAGCLACASLPAAGGAGQLAATLLPAAPLTYPQYDPQTAFVGMHTAPFGVEVDGEAFAVFLAGGTTQEGNFVFDRFTAVSRVADDGTCTTCGDATASCPHRTACQAAAAAATHCPTCGRWMNPAAACTYCNSVSGTSAAGATNPTSPATVNSKVTSLDQLPRQGNVIGARDIVQAMFAGGPQTTYQMPDRVVLEDGKRLTPNANLYPNINLQNVLAPEGATSRQQVAVSGQWLSGLQAVQNVTLDGGLVHAEFHDRNTGASTETWVGVVPPSAAGAGEIRSYCTCGHSRCPEQMVALAHALGTSAGQQLLTPRFARQAAGATPPATAADYQQMTAEEALREEDAFYRSLQELDRQGVVIAVKDQSAKDYYEQLHPPQSAALPAAPPPTPPAPPVAVAPDSEVEVEAAPTPLPVSPPPPPPSATADFFSTLPEGLTPEQRTLADAFGRGLPPARGAEAYELALRSLIPNPTERSHYVATDAHLMAARLLNQRMRAGNAGRRVMGLYGPPGTGKNELAEQIAGLRQAPYFSADCTNGLDASALTGGETLVATENGTESRVQLGPLARVAAAGGVVCINEIVAADPRVQTGLYDMIAERRIQVQAPGGEAKYYPVHEDTVFVITWNPGKDGEMPNDALRSRIGAIELPPPSQTDQERQLASIVSREAGTEVTAAHPVVKASVEMIKRLRTANRDGTIRSEATSRDAAFVASYLIDCQRMNEGGKISEENHRDAMRLLGALADQSPSIRAEQLRDIATIYYNLFSTKELGLTRQLDFD